MVLGGLIRVVIDTIQALTTDSSERLCKYCRRNSPTTRRTGFGGHPPLVSFAKISEYSFSSSFHKILSDRINNSCFGFN